MLRHVRHSWMEGRGARDTRPSVRFLTSSDPFSAFFFFMRARSSAFDAMVAGCSTRVWHQEMPAWEGSDTVPHLQAA